MTVFLLIILRNFKQKKGKTNGCCWSWGLAELGINAKYYGHYVVCTAPLGPKGLRMKLWLVLIWAKRRVNNIKTWERGP